MADDKAAREFSHLKDLARKAKLKDKIAGLSENSRGSKLAKILSEAQQNIKTNVAGGYLTSLTGVVDTLEEIPPSEWSRGADIIKEILDVARRDPYLQGTDDLLNLGLIGNDLISEVLRQAKYTTRATKALANTAKRLGRGALDKGADYRSYGGRIARTFAFGVRTVSRIARAGLARSDRKAEAQKTAAGARSRALADVQGERRYGRSADELESGEDGGGLAPQQLDAAKGTEENTQGILDFLKPAGQLNLFGDDSPQLIKLTDAIVDQTNTAVKLDDEKQSRDRFAATEAAEEAKPSRVEGLLEKILGKTGKGGKKEGGLLSGLFGILGKLFGALGGVIPKLIALGLAAWGAKEAWDWIDEKVESFANRYAPNMGPESRFQATTDVVRSGVAGARVAAYGAGRGINALANSPTPVPSTPPPAMPSAGILDEFGKPVSSAADTVAAAKPSMWSKMGGYGKSALKGIISSPLGRIASRGLRILPWVGAAGAGLGMYAANENIKAQEEKIAELQALDTPEALVEIAERENSIYWSKKTKGLAIAEMASLAASGGTGVALQVGAAGLGIAADLKSVHHANKADDMAAERTGTSAERNGPLQIKEGAGDPAQPGVMDFAEDVGTIPGFNRITSLRRRGDSGRHGSGLAMDFTIDNPAASGQAV
jgi:hypothetical protein